MKITEIMGLGGKHYFLKEGKYHSYNTYCYFDKNVKFKYYAIDGAILTPEESRIFVLRKKLNKLMNHDKAK